MSPTVPITSATYYPVLDPGQYINVGPVMIESTSNSTTATYVEFNEMKVPSILYNSYFVEDDDSYADTTGSIMLDNLIDYGTGTKINKKYVKKVVKCWATSAATTGTIYYPHAECSTIGNPWKQWITWGSYKYNDSDGWHTCKPVPLTPEEQVRRAIRERLSPAIHISRRTPLTQNDEREIRARETLRRMIGADQYQRYMRQGFITIRSKVNGLTYQLFGQGGVKVWKNGERIESWCVLLTGGFPPTDQLIMRYLLCINNPEKLRKMANVTAHGRTAQIAAANQPQPVLQKSLAELFRTWKGEKVAV